MEEKQEFAGVDGCKFGWVVVTATRHKLSDCLLFDSLQGVLSMITSKGLRAAIDIPLGINEINPRNCDRQAAGMLRLYKKTSSVFPMPAFDSIVQIEKPYFSQKDFKQYKDFNCEHNKKFGRKIPLATFCIMNKLYEANKQYADQIKKLQQSFCLFEFHPELFWYFSQGDNSSQDALSKKKSLEGRNARLKILKKYWEPENIDGILNARSSNANKVNVDDIIDAMAGATLARDFAKSREIKCEADVAPNGIDILIRY